MNVNFDTLPTYMKDKDKFQIVDEKICRGCQHFDSYSNPWTEKCQMSGYSLSFMTEIPVGCPFAKAQRGSQVARVLMEA